jgi:hypothetical protein
MSAYQPVRRTLLYATAVALCLAEVESTTILLAAQERGPDEEVRKTLWRCSCVEEEPHGSIHRRWHPWDEVHCAKGVGQ